MVKIAALCFISFLIVGTAIAGAAEVKESDLTVIESRLCENLLQNKADAALLYIDAKTREQYAAGHVSCVSKWMAAQRDDGSWTDIDYADKRRSSWPVTVHAARMAMMAIEYAAADSKLFQNQQLASAILRAWDWWTSKDLRNSNWYPNRISVPGNLCVVALFLKDRMSATQWEAGLKIIKRAQAGSTGSNLAEMAMIQIGWGCLTGDPSAVQDAFGKVAADIKPRKSDGLQPDHSLRYHGTQLYAGSYGSVYTMKVAFLIWLASGTSFQFPEDKTKFFSAYVLDGQRWMIYRGEIDPGAIGRAITIPNMPRGYVENKILPGVSTMVKVSSPRQKEFIGFKNELTTGESTLSGNRFFWNTLLMTHRRADYCVSVRMCSDEVANAEQCNLEGLQTHHTADGVTIIKRTGQEYTGIFPVWYWARIPGITAIEGPPPSDNPRYTGTAGFVGGVSDGIFGAAAFDLENRGLSAKKVWFCFDREIVCLGTDIGCSGTGRVLTSVNQCLLSGKVSQGKNWVAHDGIGYVFPSGDRFALGTEKQTGSWRLINGNMPDTPIQKNVFNLWLDHGKAPKDAGYAYIILPGVKPEQMPRYVSPITILSNNANVQAVKHTKLGAVQAVFRRAGKVSIGNGRYLSVDGPCLVMLKEDGKRMTVTVAGEARFTEEPASVTVALEKSGRSTSVRFELPQGDLAGQSIARVLAKA